MANPRNTTDFTNLDNAMETFAFDSTIVYDKTKVGGAAQVGLAVTLTGAANRTVSTVGNNEKVVGKLVAVESDGFCTVQVRGFCTLPGGNGATLTLGTSFQGALGAASAEGYIQTGTTAGVSRGVIVDPSDPTAVIVNLNS